jgi:hypothetical protein
VREFPGPATKSHKTKEKAISFLCIVDNSVNPNSDCFWMKLLQWNSSSHDMFKEQHDDELPFIQTAVVETVVNAVANAVAQNGQQIPMIKHVFWLHGC